MKFEISTPESIQLDSSTTLVFKQFMQGMANRRAVGALRYGDKPTYKQKYLSRIRLELKAYKETGNYEHLLNLANYCFLESEAPQNKKFHFDPTAASATRAKLSGNIA